MVQCDAFNIALFSIYILHLQRQVNICTWHQMASYHIHILWVFMCCAARLAEECRRTDSIEDYRLHGHVISSHRESSIWSCFQACRNTIKCQSLNYNVETSVCELNNRTKQGKPDKFVAMEGNVYADNPFRGKFKKIQYI